MPWPSNLFEDIRKRPGLYIGECSLSALYYTIGGYSLALIQHKLPSDDHLPSFGKGFHDWVAYRLHFPSSTSGWRNMILSVTPNEAEAFHHFFKLHDEYLARKAVTFATLVQPGWDDSACNALAGLFRNDLQALEEAKRPKTVSLISYTDDPGFFAITEKGPIYDSLGDLYSSIDQCEQSTKTNCSHWTIINQTIFERIQSQNPEQQ